MRRDFVLPICTVLVVVLLAVGRTLAGIRDGDDSKRVCETLDRGLIARPTQDGDVYVGWRLLASDPTDVAFNVYRHAGDEVSKKLNDKPIRRCTNLVVNAPSKADKVKYFVRPVVKGKEGASSVEVSAGPPDDAKPYVSIKLDGDHTFQKVGIADLNGDGQFDFVIKQPNSNIDPYENYWKRSPDTYKLEAYLHDGTFLWRHDLGWAIERGIWYSPYVVYDLNGDGKAEVAVKTGEGDPRDESAEGRVLSGPEYLTILDGMTGKSIAKLDWPPRSLFKETHRPYNYASRNQLGVAYLDGKTPSLIVERGTYNVIVVIAYQLRDGKLQQIWQWDNLKLGREYQGQGAHWMHAADVDDDGRQEILLGSAVLDDNGKALWTTGFGHPDHFYVGDIDPSRKGLEIYYGIESRRKDRNGMCLVDATTGEILWGHEGFTRHVHGQGMCSDIDASHPGSECYSADTDTSKKFAWCRLRTSKGEVISDETLGGFSPRCIHWDADPQRELLRKGRISNYKGPELPTRIEGHNAAVADILGDWREEAIVSVPGELRIYTTTIPTTERHVCLMQDPLYRMDVVMAAMGYFQVPLLSFDLATSKR